MNSAALMKHGANDQNVTLRRRADRSVIGLIFACLVFPLFAAAAVASEPPAASSDQLHVFPTQIQLTSATDSHRLLVVAIDSMGVTTDVTTEAKMVVENPSIAGVKGGVVIGLTDGETSIDITYGERSFQLPVKANGVAQSHAMSFRLDVLPAITKSGCNSGACHGSSQGKDGFRLSLFGFDPAGDYLRITRALASRRINLAVPEESLILRKATGAVQHTGGKRMEVGSDSYTVMKTWLDEGAHDDPVEVATVDRIELYPPEAVIQGIGNQQPLSVVAFYSDGSDRDVTDLAIFFSNDDATVSVDQGSVVAKGRGEAFVTARFAKYAAGIPVLVLPDELDFSAPSTKGLGEIDRLVTEKLNKLRIPASPRCSDEEFLRRATLDTTGLLPTEAEWREFVSDDQPGKRQRWAERLVARDEFADVWVAKWADVLMIKPVNNLMSEKATLLYFQWLREQIASGVPFDQTVREVLSSSGSTFSVPSTNFYARDTDRLKTAENVAQIFLGIRTQCAQCHNHPFDRWTLDDYYGFAAFFGQVGRKKQEDVREWNIFKGGGDTRHPITNAVVPPKFLGAAAPEIAAAVDRRQVVADWITSSDNPYFARNVANRVWAHFMGRGIVEPVDDFRVSNPPSNQALLDALANRLIESQYDLRQLAKDILNSEAYQRSSQPLAANAHDKKNFSRANIRRIEAVHLMDCFSQVTDSPTKYPQQPLGTRAVETPDPVSSNPFFSTFGRSERSTACACETSAQPTLSQALHLLNGDSVHRKIQQGKLVPSRLSSGDSPEEIIRAIYVRSLTREPTPEELAMLMKRVPDEAPRESLEDIFWAVLNSREFIYLK